MSVCEFRSFSWMIWISLEILNNSWTGNIVAAQFSVLWKLGEPIFNAPFSINKLQSYIVFWEFLSCYCFLASIRCCYCCFFLLIICEWESAFVCAGGVCVCVRVVFGRGAQFDFGLLTVQRVFESFHFQLAVDLLLQWQFNFISIRFAANEKQRAKQTQNNFN